MRELDPGLVAGKEDDEARSRREAVRFLDQATKARGDHFRRLRSLEDVFGPAVRAAAEEHLERFTESSSEAVYHLERLVSIGDLDRDRLNRDLVEYARELVELRASFERAVELPEIMVERGVRYFAATHRARPVWLKEAIAELRRLRAARRAEQEGPF